MFLYLGVPVNIPGTCVNGKDSDSVRAIARITPSRFLLGMVNRVRPLRDQHCEPSHSLGSEGTTRLKVERVTKKKSIGGGQKEK
jgi:hypothetical protein